MSVQVHYLLSLRPTDVGADTHITLNLMLEHRQVIGAVHVKNAAPFVVVSLVSLHACLFGEATG